MCLVKTDQVHSGRGVGSVVLPVRASTIRKENTSRERGTYETMEVESEADGGKQVDGDQGGEDEGMYGELALDGERRMGGMHSGEGAG